MPKTEPWPLTYAAGCAALFGGFLIGYADIHVTEVIVTLILVIALNMVLGVIAPRRALYWPFLSAIGTPLVNGYPALAHATPNPHFASSMWSYCAVTVLLLIAGTVGMLFGLVVRRTAEMSRSSQNQG
jgi:hypothetical protein